MDHLYNPQELKNLNENEGGFVRTTATERQYHELEAIGGIIQRSMQETGTFADKLDQYSGAYAAQEKISANKARTMIGEVYKARTGEWMSQTLEKLRTKVSETFNPDNPAYDSLKQEAYRAANNIGRAVEQGNKMSSFRATAYEAHQFATNLGVTDAAAKKFIAQSFKEIEGREFHEWTKQLDETYYRPQIEAEKQERQAKRSQHQAQKRSPQPSMS